jgi:sugar phosphate isomerase/epimerase
MSNISLGIVSDEISSDFDEAVQHGLSWGVSLYEIRVLRTGRVPDVQEEEFQKVIETAREKGVKITALSPGTFKQPLSQTADLERELAETLPRTIALAKKSSTSMIITFGFQRQEGESPSLYDRAVEYMGKAAEVAAKEGIRLAIENEPGFWCDTGVNTLRLIRDVNSSALGANWDPCNAYGTDERPYSRGLSSSVSPWGRESSIGRGRSRHWSGTRSFNTSPSKHTAIPLWRTRRTTSRFSAECWQRRPSSGNALRKAIHPG